MESVPAASAQSDIDHVNLVSYDDALLDMIMDNVVQGDLSGIYGNSEQVMTVIGKDNPLSVGDTVQIADETIREISSLADGNIIYSDLRERNQEDRITYAATRFLIYSFLMIIAMISLFNIMNSISMSVTARTKQYGAMRAVGMDSRQITQMIFSEAFTYALSGLLASCGIGAALSRFLYIRLVTRYFGAAWSFPIALFGIVVVFILVSVVMAVRKPCKRLCNMSITTTLNEL